MTNKKKGRLNQQDNNECHTSNYSQTEGRARPQKHQKDHQFTSQTLYSSQAGAKTKTQADQRGCHFHHRHWITHRLREIRAISMSVEMSFQSQTSDLSQTEGRSRPYPCQQRCHFHHRHHITHSLRGDQGHIHVSRDVISITDITSLTA
jgi:hypothetical protein